MEMRPLRLRESAHSLEQEVALSLHLLRPDAPKPAVGSLRPGSCSALLRPICLPPSSQQHRRGQPQGCGRREKQKKMKAEVASLEGTAHGA